jgi:hypothetical protein
MIQQKKYTLKMALNNNYTILLVLSSPIKEAVVIVVVWYVDL